ncbi:MAG: L-serine ammonia-lyase, iron-sulfur-dependent, subunit alpha [Thermodesulfobacteriota bacterium]
MSFLLKDILRMEVAPALGCTEPVAIALAAAAAASLLPPGDIRSIEVWVDPNVYKNGLAVCIPGTPGLTGLDTAAALGALGGDPSLRLEVLEPVTPEVVQAAVRLKDRGLVRVHVLDQSGLHVRAVVARGESEAEALITGTHDNLVSLSRDGRPAPDSPLLRGAGPGDKGGLAELERWLRGLSLSDLVDLARTADEEDLEFLQESVRYNLLLAEYGLLHGPGLGVGKAMERLVRQRLIRKDMILAARMLTSAAADARMSGVKMAAMSSAGSGNHGLTAVLPIWAVKDYVECAQREVLEAVCLSHLVTGYVKAHTGRLSALCGCSVAAGSGAAAGVTYLLGGGVAHMAGAMKNLIQDLAGVICDGAKLGCAMKLATAAGAAVQAALFALQGVVVGQDDGIIGATLEKTTENLGALSTQGMVETDRTILRILTEKRLLAE